MAEGVAAAAQRPDIVGEHAVHPRTAVLHVQDHEGGPQSRVVVAEPVIAVGGQLSDGPTPQIQAPGFAGERNAEICASPMPLTPPCPGANAGSETMGRMVRVMMFHSSLTENRNHRLDIEHVLRAIQGSDIEVRVLLEWHADEIAHWILRDLRQILGAQFGMSRFRQATPRRTR